MSNLRAWNLNGEYFFTWAVRASLRFRAKQSTVKKIRSTQNSRTPNKIGGMNWKKKKKIFFLNLILGTCNTHFLKFFWLLPMWKIQICCCCCRLLLGVAGAGCWRVTTIPENSLMTPVFLWWPRQIKNIFNFLSIFSFFCFFYIFLFILTVVLVGQLSAANSGSKHLILALGFSDTGHKQAVDSGQTV